MDILEDDNKLLKAFCSDLEIRSYLCGCRALGLVNKFVTGTLWKLLESGIHIFSLNKHYQKMRSLFFDLSVNVSEFMLGKTIFFQKPDEEIPER